MHKLSDDRLDEIGSLLQRGEGMFADGIGKELLCLCLELRSLRSIMRSVESHDEYLRIQFAEIETNQMPLPGLEEIIANQPTVAEAMLTRANEAKALELDPRMVAGAEAAHPDWSMLERGIEDAEIQHRETIAMFPSKPQGVNALLDPLCECGHTASDHVGRTGPCRRTPCGVKCRCDAMTVKV